MSRALHKLSSTLLVLSRILTEHATRDPSKENFTVADLVKDAARSLFEAAEILRQR